MTTPAPLSPVPLPCVRSKRSRVYQQHAHLLKHICAWCRHTRGRFECTHGGVFESTHGFFNVFSACRNTHQTHHDQHAHQHTPTHTNTHTHQHAHNTHTTQHGHNKTTGHTTPHTSPKHGTYTSHIHTKTHFQHTRTSHNKSRR